MALYYGEPVTGMTYSLWLLLNATILWVWGQYGAPAGMGASITMWFLAMRFLVCIFNLSGWESAETKREHERLKAAGCEIKKKNSYGISRAELEDQIKKRDSKELFKTGAQRQKQEAKDSTQVMPFSHENQ